jgi:tetratricopeptide (TPR) repeat protein
MVDDQVENSFIGHEEELKIFRDWLDSTGPQEPSILFFYDSSEERKGGIGKTWLLNKCSQQARERQNVAVVRIDFFSIQDRDGAEIARRVVDSVKQVYPSWTPNAFERDYDQYRQSLQQQSKDDSLLLVLRTSLVNDLAELQKQLGDHRRHIVIFCDTYERVEHHPEQISFSAGNLFPDNYDCQLIGFLVAGRNPPAPESASWRGRMELVRSLALQPFTLDEMRTYFEKKIRVPGVLPLTSADATKLYTGTDGRPILVGLLTDMLNRRFPLKKLLEVAPPNFERYLVEQINPLTSSTDWAVFCMAHAYHRFNPSILNWLSSIVEETTQDVRIGEVWEQLKALSFVRASATREDIALHDEMRRLVLLWSWPEQSMKTSSQRQALSEHMITYYEQEIKKEQSIQLRQAYQVEMLYHLLCVDLSQGFDQSNRGFAFFLELVEPALRLKQNTYARSLIQEVRQFEHDLLPEQRYSLMMQEAELLQNEENYKDALDLYEEYLQRLKETAWLAQHRADISRERGICFTRLSQFSEAIYALNYSLEIYETQQNSEQLAVTYSRIGYAYDRQGNWDTAVKYYKKSIELHCTENNRSGYADSLNSLAWVYRSQGNLEEALRICRIGLRLREELYKEQKESERSIGFSCSALGRIYYALGESPQAKRFFQRAYEIYERTSYQKGIASTYTHFGQFCLDKGELEEADKYFKKAYSIAIYIDSEAEIRSLNRQSHVLFQQNKADEAISLLRKAIERASTIKDFYQQTESLVDLANFLFQSGSSAEALHILQEAEVLAETYHYYYLLGMIKKARGDIYRSDGHYHEAFQFYMLYCHAMAYHNQAEYLKAVRHTVTEDLMELPRDMIGQIWQQLSDNWSTLELEEEKHVHMEQALQQVRLFLDM